MELEFRGYGGEFIVGPPDLHEPFQVAALEAGNLTYELFVEAIVDEFIGFFLEYTVLQLFQVPVAAEAEQVDDLIGVEACASVYRVAA